jgi:hypothetical protein
METKAAFKRPAFHEVVDTWKKTLSAHGHSTDLVWIFDENLCFEKDASAPGGMRVAYQTRFTPPPEDAAGIAYEDFLEFDAPLVLYRLGESNGKSICLLLCDEWFDSKGEKEGYICREDWRMMFHPGDKADLEEIRDEQRWKARLVKDRPLHPLDFCMTLRAVQEIIAHGYALSEYERYALKFLHFWRRSPEQPE